MLQPPANKICFEVFLNHRQGLNDSQKQRYVCGRACVRADGEPLSPQDLCESVHVVHIYVSGKEADDRRVKRKRR